MTALFTFFGHAEVDPARLLAYATCHTGRPTLLLPACRRWWTPTLNGLHELARTAGIRVRTVTDGTVRPPGAPLPAWDVVDEITGRLGREGGHLVLLDDLDCNAELAEVARRAQARGLVTLDPEVLHAPIVDAELVARAAAPAATWWQLRLDRDEVAELVERVLPFAAARGGDAGIHLDVEDGRRIWRARCADVVVRFIGEGAGPGDTLPVALPARLVPFLDTGVGPGNLTVRLDDTLVAEVDGTAVTCVGLPRHDPDLVEHGRGGTPDLRFNDLTALRERLDALLRAACEPPLITLELDGQTLRLAAHGTGEPTLTTELRVGPTDADGAGPRTTVDGRRLARVLRAAPDGPVELLLLGWDGIELRTTAWQLHLVATDELVEERAQLTQLLETIVDGPVRTVDGGLEVDGPHGELRLDFDADRHEVLLTARAHVGRIPPEGRDVWVEQLRDGNPGVAVALVGDQVVATGVVDAHELNATRLRRGLCRLADAIGDLPAYQHVVTTR